MECANSRNVISNKKESYCIKCHKKVFIHKYSSHSFTKCNDCVETVIKKIKPIIKCDYCNKIINGRHSSKKKYCNTKCVLLHRKEKNIKEITDGKCNSSKRLKNYLIETLGHKCEICKRITWNGVKIPLIMDHVDGRANNNILNNLRLVCGNCDMLLPTYKSKNKNSDRRNRKKYK